MFYPRQSTPNHYSRTTYLMTTENHKADDGQSQRELTTRSSRSETAKVGMTNAKIKEVRATSNTTYHGALRMNKRSKVCMY